MKNFNIWLLLILIATSLFSCKDEIINEQNDNINLKSTEIFRYDFNITGDEEGATIIQQAGHFEISELQRDESTNWSIVYRYKPEQGYVGKDSVIIETCTGGTGVICTDLDTVKLVFEVGK